MSRDLGGWGLLGRERLRGAIEVRQGVVEVKGTSDASRNRPHDTSPVRVSGAAPAASAAPTFYGIVPGPQPDAQDAQGIAGARIHTARILINWRATQPTRNATNWRRNRRDDRPARVPRDPTGAVRVRVARVGSPGSRAAADRNAGPAAGMAQLPARRGGALRTRRQLLDHGVPKPAVPRRGAVARSSPGRSGASRTSPASTREEQWRAPPKSTRRC